MIRQNESIINRKISHCEIIVSDDAIDQNGHVNNVVYVQWMQDIAMRHSELTGGTAAAEAANGIWVARTHTIEYLSPAYEGDHIEAFTWIVDYQRVRSRRRYKFVINQLAKSAQEVKLNGFLWTVKKDAPEAFLEK